MSAIVVAAIDWTGAATLALAAVTTWLAIETRRVVKATRSEAAATLRAVVAAETQAVEVTRARIDARAPRVVVHVTEPEWPPYAPSPSYDRNALPSRLNERQAFIVPGDGDQHVMIRTWGWLRNEGLTTAVVTLPSSCAFTGEPDPDRRQPAPLDTYVVPTALGNDRYALEPGQQARFWFQGSRTVTDWAQAWDHQADTPDVSRVYAEIIVTDTFDDGIADNTLIEIQAYPLRPGPGNAASWQVRWSGDLTAPQRAAAVVHPTRRRYWTSKQRDQLLL